jgi:predicted nucleic acid-binding protein
MPVGAATALLSRAPLLTHNRWDYLSVPGLALISHAG